MPGRMDSAVPQSYTFFQSLYFIYRSIFEIYTIYLSIYLPTYLSIYLPTYLSIYLSIYIYNIYLSISRAPSAHVQVLQRHIPWSHAHKHSGNIYI